MSTSAESSSKSDGSVENVEALAAVYLADRAELTQLDTQLFSIVSLGLAYIVGVGTVWGTVKENVPTVLILLSPGPLFAVLVMLVMRLRLFGATAESARQIQTALLRATSLRESNLELGIWAQYESPTWSKTTYTAASVAYGIPFTVTLVYSAVALWGAHLRGWDEWTIVSTVCYLIVFVYLAARLRRNVIERGARLAL